jgi:enoyl-CoA hydratase/carnithine racemase
MSYQTILYEVAEGVATITLNRPDVLNAVNLQMARELLHAIEAVRADASVRVVLLSGAGRAFCAPALISSTWVRGSIPATLCTSGARARRVLSTP